MQWLRKRTLKVKKSQKTALQFTDGSWGDQSNHATTVRFLKMPGERTGKKNSPGVKLRTALYRCPLSSLKNILQAKAFEHERTLSGLTHKFCLLRHAIPAIWLAIYIFDCSVGSSDRSSNLGLPQSLSNWLNQKISLFPLAGFFWLIMIIRALVCKQRCMT